MNKRYIIICLIGTLASSCICKRNCCGWYSITNPETKAVASRPIVTTADFETIRIDSTPDQKNTMTYSIVGKIKPEKLKKWGDATERAIGKQIGFLCKGKIICAPQVNMRIDSGNFAITSHELYKDREKAMELFEYIEKEMQRTE